MNPEHHLPLLKRDYVLIWKLTTLTMNHLEVFQEQPDIRGKNLFIV